MKINFKIFISLIITFFLFLFSNNLMCLAVDSTKIPYNVFNNDGTSLKRGTATIKYDSSGNFEKVEYSGLNEVSDLETTFVNIFCNRFQAFMDEDETKREDLGDTLIPMANLQAHTDGDQAYMITNLPTYPLSKIVEITNNIIDEDTTEYSYTTSFSLKGKSSESLMGYNFTFYTKKCIVQVAHTEIDTVTGDLKTVIEDEEVYKSEVRDKPNNLPDGYYLVHTYTENELRLLEMQYKIAVDAQEGFKAIYDSLRIGLIAGSVGSGYNVGTVYSTNQLPLSDVLEENEEKTAYDFKNANAMKTTFSYYMNPLLGRVDFTNKEKPTDIAGWKKIVDDLTTNFIDGTDVVISDKFTSFSSGLTDKGLNSEGLKITKTVKFVNGITALKDVGASTNPKSVIDYKMKIAYPYVFYKVGSNYKLLTNSLRIDENYLYCLYDQYIRDYDMNLVTNLTALKMSDSELFLYYQIDTTGKYIGVVLIGVFDECVIDTSDSNNGVLYATGRKIGFNNGYSDVLHFNEANRELMYSKMDGESGKQGFRPKNVAFLPSDENIEKIQHNKTVIPQAIIEGQDEIYPLDISNSENIKSQLSQMQNHDVINSDPSAFELNILFTSIINQSGAKELENVTNKEKVLKEKGLMQYGFVILRNNRVINDAELIAWLKTEKARSYPYVDAAALLAKITGDFLGDVEKLSYEDWRSMQSIKAQLQQNKDLWLIRLLNIMMIVMGVGLIIFAVLICLAYWIDIFNTLADFSILQFISFGNMFPVESKDLIPYVSESKGNIKYVTFKDVLFIAGVCVAVGVLFMNSSTVVTTIIYLYNYILAIFRGL